MRRNITTLLGLGLAAGLVSTGAVTAFATPPPQAPPAPSAAEPEPAPRGSDVQTSPWGVKQQALRRQALDLVLTGQRTVEHINGSSVVKVGRKPAGVTPTGTARKSSGDAVRAPRMVDQYVELGREQTDKVFVVLAEFGDQRDPRFPDRDTNPAVKGPATFDGPRHNRLPEPAPDDNWSDWLPDYSASYFRKLYFGEGDGVESLKTYYEKQSSGRYSVDGTVTGWVKVPYNEARYGRSSDDPSDANGDDPDVCALKVCDNSWALVRDGMNQWVTDQKRLFGRRDAQIRRQLAEFDQQDRYDYDGDGDFNEPDGYIDHFQVVHAGGDEADGDPYQGEDAIWSHRGYAYSSDFGRTGPGANKRGGAAVAGTGLWISDYTMQAENGGLSTIAHEYGHDLDLPDLYDRFGSQVPVEWWSLMSQSRSSAPGDQGVSTRAADLGAWEKLQLGWLDHEITVAGQKRTLELGPHAYNSAKPQGLVTVLPPKAVVTALPPPTEGAKQWWSGTGDDADVTLTREVSLPMGAASLTFQASWNIEDCGDEGCDYAYVEVDDGTGWKAVPGSISIPAEGNGIDGDSGGYRPASFDLSRYAGTTVGLRFRYRTDAAVRGADASRPAGLFVDDIRLVAGGRTVFADGAEDGQGGWISAGFSQVGASVSESFPQYYLASHRSYAAYDRYLRTGPFTRGYGLDRPNRVDHFPYQDGLQVTYWDGRYADNDVSEHPGHGLALVVDAHPDPIYRLDGQPWRAGVQIYDATFGLQKADSFTLHGNAVASYVRGQAAQPLFDDTRSYFRAAIPLSGVRVAGAGVTLRVLEQGDTSMRVALGTSSSVSASTTLAAARKAVRAA